MKGNRKVTPTQTLHLRKARFSCRGGEGQDPHLLARKLAWLHGGHGETKEGGHWDR